MCMKRYLPFPLILNGLEEILKYSSLCAEGDLERVIL